MQSGAAEQRSEGARRNALIRNFLVQDGEGGLQARRITVPGARKAVLVTLPASTPGHSS